MSTQHQLLKLFGNSSFYPTHFGNQLQLWLDPYDTTTMTLQNASILKKASSQTYAMPVSSSNPFDFNTSGTSYFCISMWIYNEIGALNDQGIIGNLGSSKGWDIVWAGVGTNELETDIVPSAGTFAFNTFSFNTGPATGASQPGNWFHLFWNYDGSFHGDDTKVLFVAINGNQIATGAGSQLGQLVKAVGNGGSLTIGGNAFGVYGDMRIMDIAIYNHSAGGNGVGTSAVQTACTAMYNKGQGVVKATLPSGMTDPIAYYACGDSVSSGILADSSGNGYNLSATATVTAPAQMLWAWKDKSPNGFTFQVADGATQGIAYDGNFQILRNRLCRYFPSYGTWGTPAVVAETGNAGLYTLATNWCGSNLTGHQFLTIGETGLSTNETFELVTGNDANLIAHHELWMTGIEGPSNQPPMSAYTPCLRIANSTSAGDLGTYINAAGSTIPGNNFATIVGNTYYPNDGSKQYRMFANTAVYPPTFGSGLSVGGWRISINSALQISNWNNNGASSLNWFAATMSGADRTYIALNAFYRYCTDSGSIYNRNSVFGCTQAYGDIMVFSPCLNPIQELAANKWIASR